MVTVKYNHIRLFFRSHCLLLNKAKKTGVLRNMHLFCMEQRKEDELPSIYMYRNSFCNQNVWRQIILMFLRCIFMSCCNFTLFLFCRHLHNCVQVKYLFSIYLHQNSRNIHTIIVDIFVERHDDRSHLEI